MDDAMNEASALAELSRLEIVGVALGGALYLCFLFIFVRLMWSIFKAYSETPKHLKRIADALEKIADQQSD